MDSKKIKICNSQNYSEFNEEMLKSSGFFKAIKRILYDTANIFNKKERIEYTIKELNKFFAEESKKNPSESKSFNWNSPKTDELLQEDVQDMISYELYREIGYNSNIYEIVKIDFSEKLRKLRESLLSLGHDNCYDRKAVEDYLNNFCNFIIDIFKKENWSNRFIKSRIPQNINYLGEIPFENSTLAKKGFSYVNMYSPYVADAIERIIYNIAEREYQGFDSISEMKELRYAMLINQAEYAFDRNSLYYGTFTRVMFDKNEDEIISKPFESLSSVENINPVMLFEKIVTYIGKELDRLKKNKSNVKVFDINVLIIGNTGTLIEKDGIKINPELCDLINSIVYWYNRSFTDDEPKLNLVLNAIVNEDNILRECADIECAVNENKGVAQINSLNYVSEFFNNFSRLQEFLNTNDMLFILNCPWLYCSEVRSYKIGEIGQPEYFANPKNWSALRDIICDNFYSSFLSKVQRIGEGYLSLIDSDLQVYGSLKIYVNDYIIRFLENYCKSSKNLKLKEVYVYYSDENKTSINWTRLGTWILQKTELCDGKYFTVAKFTNEKSKELSYINNPKVNFKISLWNLLKYISFGFVFTNFKELINKYFGNYIKNAENYFEIYRDIILFFETNKNLYEVNLSLRFSDRLNKLADELKIPIDHLEKLKNEFHDEILRFIKPLFENIVFADRNGFGNKFIKSAFEISLYDNAEDVNAMFFLHYYQKSRNKNKLKLFKINWNEYNDIPLASENYTHELFSDKLSYNVLFNYFDDTNNLSIGTRAMLYQSEEMIDYKDSLIDILRENIKSIYEIFCEEKTIWRNADSALREPR